MRKLRILSIIYVIAEFFFTPGIGLVQTHAQGYCPSFATTAHVISAANLPYTLSSGDFCNLLVINAPNATGIINLPTPGTAFTPAGYTVSIRNESTGGQITLATIQNPLTFYTPLIDLGQTTANTPIIPPGGAVILYNNGTDWFSVGFNAGTGPIYINTLNFGAPNSGAPVLGVTITGSLFYTANGVTQSVGLFPPSTGLNLSKVSFSSKTNFMLPSICSYAPIGATGNGPPEWMILTDPTGYIHSIPLC